MSRCTVSKGPGTETIPDQLVLRTHPQRYRHCPCTGRAKTTWSLVPALVLSHSASGLPSRCFVSCVRVCVCVRGSRVHDLNMLKIVYHVLQCTCVFNKCSYRVMYTVCRQ